MPGLTIHETSRYDVLLDIAVPVVPTESLVFTGKSLSVINFDIMTTDFMVGTTKYSKTETVRYDNFRVGYVLEGNMLFANTLQLKDNFQCPRIIGETIDTKTMNFKSINGDQVAATNVTSNTVTATTMMANLFNGTATFALNAATAECCDYVYDKYFDGKVKEEDKNKEDFKFITIDETFEFVQKNRHLPTIMGREEFNKDNKQLNLGKIISQLWETIEIQSIYIKELNDRIKTLEERIK